MSSEVNNLVVLGEKTVKVLKPMFVRQSDPALYHLTTVLDEISKMFEAMNIVITSYLSLSFDPSDKQSFERGKSRLLELEGGYVDVEMCRVKGHSAKIGNIYHTYRSLVSSDFKKWRGGRNI